MPELLEPQRKRLAIAMSKEQRDDYLSTRRMCRLATISPKGVPHVSPLWFVWDGDHAWIYSIVKSQRWKNVSLNPKVAMVVDDGDRYEELRGIEITGTMESVGEIPRNGEPYEELEIPERLFAEKNSTQGMTHDGRHAWLRLTPGKIVSWDFTKVTPLK